MSKTPFHQNKPKKKFVAVLNRQVELGSLLNCMGHISVSLASRIDEPNYLDYKDKSCNIHPNISDSPYIVLKAKNSNQIRVLRNKLIELGLPVSDFTDTMTIGNTDEQLKATCETEECDLNYLGLVTYAEAEVLTPLTKKFSLFV